MKAAPSDLAVSEEVLWVADPATHTVLECEFDLKGCRTALELPQKLRARVIHITPIPNSSDFYVSSSRGVVARVSRNGEIKTLIEPEEGWAAPNTVTLLNDGRLAVADTNHHRLVLIDPTARLGEKTVAASTDFSRGGRIWPVVVKQHRDGTLWSINGDGTLEQGDILVYSPEGAPRKRVDLGEKADPVSLTPWGEVILISDYGRNLLLRVDGAGEAFAFGAGELATALEEGRKEREAWQGVNKAGWGGLVVAVLIVVAAALLDQRARQEAGSELRKVGAVRHPETLRPPAAALPRGREIRPDRSGIIWLAPSASFRRSLKVIGYGTPLLVAWPLATLFLLDSAPLTYWLPMLGLSVAIGALALYLAVQLPRIRVGSTGRVIHLRDVRGRTASAPVEEVQFTGSRLVIDEVAVGVKTHRGTVFEPDHYDAYIAPLLGRMVRVGEMELLWRKLRAGDPATWLQIALALISLAAAFWLKL